MQQSGLSLRWMFIISTAMTLLMIVGLYLLGRIWMCECGFGLYTLSGWSSETSQHLLDPYSFSHVLHGVLFYLFLFLVLRRIPTQYRFLIAVALEIAWELFENSSFIINRYRSQTAALDYFGDSILNSFGDLLSMMLGFYAAWKMPLWATLLLVIGVELGMLYFLKDNLSLNIIMLLYPIKAIKDWQLQ